MSTWSITTHKAYLSDSRVTNISSSFTYKMHAAKTSWHRYGTKLRHCHPMCRPRGAKYCDDHVCRRLSASPRTYLQNYSPFNLLTFCMLHMGVGGSVLLWRRAISYVLPVLWMTSCLHIMARNMGDAKKAHTSNDSAVGSTDLIPPHALEPAH